MVEIEVSKEVILDGETSKYGRLHQGAYKRWRVRFHEILYDWGVRRVINTITPVTAADLIYEEPTLYILPMIEGVKKVVEDNLTKTIQKDGSKIVLHPHYAVLDDSCVRIKRGNDIIADYYRQRNLIILYFNPFPYIPRTTYFRNALSLIQEQMPEICEAGNAEEINESSLERNAVAFQKNIKAAKTKIQNTIQNAHDGIETRGTQITNLYRDIIIETKKLEGVKETEKNFLPNFKKELEELEKVPFIRGVKISQKGIEADFGEIYIKRKTVKYYIGHIVVLITPDEVLFYNKNNARDKHPHPHVGVNHKACFSSYQKDVSKLIAELKLTKLVFLLGQFLQTYNPESPIYKIGYWRTKGKVKKIKSPTTGRMIALPPVGVDEEDLNDVSRAARARISRMRRTR